MTIHALNLNLNMFIFCDSCNVVSISVSNFNCSINRKALINYTVSALTGIALHLIGPLFREDVCLYGCNVLTTYLIY